MLDIIGPYPPPYGGISVHIMRLIPYYKSSGIDYTVYNHGKFDNPKLKVVSIYNDYLWWLKYLLLGSSADVVHFHFFTLIHFVYVLIFSRFHKNKIVISIHNEKLLLINPKMKNFLVFCLLKTKNKTVIAVSQKVSDYLNDNHIETIYIPAYIPPIKQKKIEDKFLDIFYSTSRDLDSIDSTYSFDMVIELLNTIEEENILKDTEYKDYKLHFFIGSKEYDYTSFSSKLASVKNQDKIVIYEEKNMSEYLGVADLLLRPNRVDAYGVSVKEALDNDIDAIASDVCRRPKGTILFKNNSMDDLLYKFRMFVKGELKYSYQNRIETNYHLRLIDIYRDLGG